MKLFSKAVGWLVTYCADVDSITQQRACVLLQVDIIALVLSLAVGFFALYYQGLPITATDAWSSFVVTIAAGASALLMLRGRYAPAAHVAVFFAYVAIWAQVFDRAGTLTTQSAVAYVVALLALPALLLGRGWTLLYGGVTVVLAGIASAHLAMAHNFSAPDAAAFGIDIVASSAFVIFVTGLLSRMYESSLNRVRGLLATQERHVGEVTELSESLKISEAHKRQFYRDTIYSVTSGKLSIYENADLDPYLRSAELVVDLPDAGALAQARRKVAEYCSARGLAGEQMEAFIIGIGEAMTNAVKHASGGKVYAGSSEQSVWVGVSDLGPGIESLILPRAVLLAGFSTKPSLGLGYTIMLDVADEIFLKTSETGTTVVLIKHTGDRAPQIPRKYRSVLQSGL